MSRFSEGLAELALALFCVLAVAAFYGLAFLLTLGAWALGMAQIIQWMVN